MNFLEVMELKERLYAALLIAKSLNIKLEVLKSSLKSNTALEKTLLPKELLTEVNEIMNINYKKADAKIIDNQSKYY